MIFSKHCKPEALRALLDGAGDDRQTARHLEECSRCRRELEVLAADDSWWQAARQNLSGAGEPLSSSSVVPIDPTHPSESSMEADRIWLEFLSQPNHPEMLGRIGRYDIERIVGRGGMGLVLKGFDTELNRPVAIKLLAPHLATSSPARRRFARGPGQRYTTRRPGPRGGR